jgi:hypothetical protein
MNFRKKCGIVALLLIPNLINTQAAVSQTRDRVKVNSIQMPIEVMGASGTTVSARFAVPASTLSSQINRLWLKMHGLSYPNKVSISINSGVWIPLNNSTVTILGPAAHYGGIGGTFSTLKMTLPVSPVTLKQNTTNQISFRFNMTDGVSSGFRVLEFNFLTPSGQRLLPDSTFVEDNPNNWKPLFTDSVNIEQGREVWKNAVLRASPLSARNLQARCSDCHAQDGRDLKYFNFSNLSIVERSKFHGLTPLQGQQIASYIRTLNVPNPGRPWNPPYQPGPGLDAKPVQEWAAGAGVDWALDDDLQTLNYIFPDGINEQAVATSGNLNVRETPVAMQFPDWNHWLPKIHPKDAWGTNFVNHNLFKKYSGEGGGSSPWNFRTKLQAATASRYVLSDIFRNELGYWGNDRYQFIAARSTGIVMTPEHSEKIYSTALWQLVKMWELVQDFNLEGLGQQIYGSRGEPRTWLTDFPFRASPFMLGIPDNQNGIGGSALTNVYFSNVWYQVQLTLNNSNRQPISTYPIDWSYVYGKHKDLYYKSNYPEAGRLVLWITKAMQESDNGLGVDNMWVGWRPTSVGDISKLVHWSFLPMWQKVPAAQKAQIQEALLRTWFAKSRQYTQLQYIAGGHVDPTYAPRSWYDGPFGDRVYYMIPQFRQSGVNEELLDEIIDWAARMWPRGNWNAIR